jgi:Cd2+/Zn2+-exporting ATPase
MILSIVVFGVVWLVVGDSSVAIYRGLVFLVVSCPCAFAISVPLTYFSGIGKCSSKGILVKGSNYLDSCAKLDRIVFDKTGTITTGKFKIKNIQCSKGYVEKEILKIVASGEQKSLHPVAISICEYYQKSY